MKFLFFVHSSSLMKASFQRYLLYTKKVEIDISTHFCFHSVSRALRLRRERDSNPRSLSAQRFSRPPQSTTLPSLLRRNALVALTAALRHWATAIPPLSSKPRASRMMFFRNRVQKYCFFLNCANFYALFLRISKFCSNFAAKFVQNAFTNTQIQDSPRNGDRSELRLHWQYHH